MRLVFWRTGKAWVQRAFSKPVPAAMHKPAVASESGDLDLRVLGQALMRNRRWIIIPTLLAAVLSIAAVNLVTPRYKSEARILIDGRDPRPLAEGNRLVEWMSAGGHPACPRVTDVWPVPGALDASDPGVIE